MKSKEQKEQERLAREAAWVAEDADINVAARASADPAPPGAMAAAPELQATLGFGRYLGGFTGISLATAAGTLGANGDRIGLYRNGSWVLWAPWSMVVNVEVTDLQTAKSRVGWVLAFGVLGLGAKATQTQTALIVRLSGDHGQGHFLIVDTEPLAARAKLTPIMQAVGVEFAAGGDDASRPPIDLADEIRKLAALKDEGLLSPEEFDAAKARLLQP